MVERIAPVVDAATGTVKVTISLPDELSGPGGFLPGMYAEVTLTTEHRDAVPLVPKSAVIHDDDQSFVFVIDGDRARKVKVELGLQDAERVELRQGPATGETIIVAGQAGLKDGALVVKVDAQGRPLDGEGKAGGGAKAGEGAKTGEAAKAGEGG